MMDAKEKTDDQTDEGSDEETDLDDMEPSPEELSDDAEPAADAEVGSIEDLLVKKEAKAEEEEAEEEDEVLVPVTREERLEASEAKVIPPQAGEFVCRNCYLVKHRSQLKDKKRMLCRDCA